MIVNSERDLNDIVTLRFEPKNTTDKSVTWSTSQNEFFTLNGSTIKANKIGSGYVTATSNVNSDLKVDVKIRVYNPRITTYKVTYAKNEVFTILSTRFLSTFTPPVQTISLSVYTMHQYPHCLPFVLELQNTLREVPLSYSVCCRRFLLLYLPVPMPVRCTFV